jgi:hypothetical protein
MDSAMMFRNTIKLNNTVTPRVIFSLELGGRVKPRRARKPAEMDSMLLFYSPVFFRFYNAMAINWQKA